MAPVIQAPVGIHAKNRHWDVLTIQQLLRHASISPGPIDGLCGRRTVGAILKFQSGFMSEPDGRIDVGGPTLQHLAKHAQGQPAVPAAKSAPHITKAALPASDPAITARQSPALSSGPARGTSPGQGNVDYTTARPLPKPDILNNVDGIHLSDPPPHYMLSRFGDPSTMSDERFPKENVGPFSVRGAPKALESLRIIMIDVRRKIPDLYPRLTTAGMRVCRNVGGSHSYSNHSWGIAIDLIIDKQLEQRGERTAQLGLLLMAPIFNEHKWFWGGGYNRTKDCMHYECSRELLDTFSSLS